jgi:hypothetical protein
MIGHFGLAFRTIIEFRAQKAISELILEITLFKYCVLVPFNNKDICSTCV